MLNFNPIPFDTETTGVNFLKSQAIQMAAIFLDSDLKVLGSFEENINYSEDFEWTSQAEAVHGIDKQTAKTHGLDISDARLSLEESIKSIYGNKYRKKDLRIVGAQSYFDYVMIRHTLYREDGNRMPFSFRVVDINGIGSILGSGDNLGSNLKHFDIEYDSSKAHNALYDAELHSRVFINQVRTISGKGI